LDLHSRKEILLGRLINKNDTTTRCKMHSFLTSATTSYTERCGSFKKMKRILSLILLFQINTIFAQNNKSLIGTYYSINNEFERWSIMDLTSDGKFIYSYGIGGCQAQVTGVYKIRNNKLIFKMIQNLLNSIWTR
jgi:hypothetical protein